PSKRETNLPFLYNPWPYPSIFNRTSPSMSRFASPVKVIARLRERKKSLLGIRVPIHTEERLVYLVQIILGVIPVAVAVPFSFPIAQSEQLLIHVIQLI